MSFFRSSLVLVFLGFTALATSAASLSSEGGRFVFGQINDQARHIYMLDTQTGRLWEMVVDENGNRQLSPVPYCAVGGKFSLPAPLDDPAIVTVTPIKSDTSKEQATATGQIKDEMGCTAEDYDTLAAKYDREGETKLAQLARERSAALRAQETK